MKIVGTVYQVTDEELLMADSYETKAYKRDYIKLQSGKSAWVYVKPK